MTDTARLQIRVESDSVDTANRRLDGLTNKGKSAESATDGLMGAFKRLAGPVAGVVSATAALDKLVDVTREFDRLNAGLITATGSSENAAAAFEALQQFAAKTPYDLAQAVDGFNKLVNLGLTPSEKALMSYGNTASAMGKDLNQMIEAVADASTGEFERLKEFGIKASSEGDRVKFTFQGITTEVGKNAAEIEQYLMALGENQFAGAMAARMDSLDGALANLGDTWDALFLTVSKSGVGDAIESGVRTATDVLQELIDMIASGEMEGYLDAIGAAWDGWGRDIEKSVTVLGAFLKEQWNQWGGDGEEVVKWLSDAFTQFPENVRAMIQIATVEVVSFFDRLIAQAVYVKDALAAAFSDSTVEEAAARYQAALNASNQARADSITAILEERDADIKASQDKAEAAKKLREEYEAQQKAKAENKEDRLAGYKRGGSSESPASVDKAAENAKKKALKEFEALQVQLRTEEEAIAASYAKRKAIIEANTAEGSALRADLMARIQKERDEDLKKYQEQKDAEFTALKESLLGEEMALNESYKKRLEIILKNTEEGSVAQAELKKKLDEQYSEGVMGDFATPDTYEEQIAQINADYEARRAAILANTQMTEEARTALEEKLTQQRNQRIKILEQQRTSNILSGTASMFESLAGLSETFAGKQSGIYKAMFMASKAFALADSIIKIQQGIANAAALPWPANLGAIASTLAATTSVISTIQSTQYAGAYDKGGQIPAGKFGIVGEYGPEVVRGPANVTGRRKTAAELAGTGGGSNVSVVVNNNAPVSVRTETTETDEGTRLEFIIEETTRRISSDIMTGDGGMTRALEGTYGSLRRGQI